MTNNRYGTTSAYNQGGARTGVNEPTNNNNNNANNANNNKRGRENITITFNGSMTRLVINERMNPSGDRWAFLIDAETRTLYLSERVPYQFIPFKPKDWELVMMNDKPIGTFQGYTNEGNPVVEIGGGGGGGQGKQEEEEEEEEEEDIVKSFVEYASYHREEIKKTNTLLRDIKQILQYSLDISMYIYSLKKNPNGIKK